MYWCMHVVCIYVDRHAQAYMYALPRAKFRYIAMMKIKDFDM